MTFSQYYKYLEHINTPSDKLKIAKDLETQCFNNTNKYITKNDKDISILYTHASTNKEKINNRILHIILPGIDLAQSLHLYTALDIVYEQYINAIENNISKDILIISPFASIGNPSSIKLYENIKKEGYKYILNNYTELIERYIQKSRNEYTQIILHGMSLGCNYAYILGRYYEIGRKMNVKIIYDNPTLLIASSPIKYIQVFFGFIFESIYRTIFDKRLYLPMRFEKEIREYFNNMQSTKTSWVLRIKMTYIIFKALILTDLNSYIPSNYEMNIGKYDLTIHPISKKILKQYNISYRNTGHYIDRLNRYL